VACRLIERVLEALDPFGDVGFVQPSVRVEQDGAQDGVRQQDKGQHGAADDQRGFGS
jgi:hypothetical protein